jgi:hypothetical protein
MANKQVVLYRKFSECISQTIGNMQVMDNYMKTSGKSAVSINENYFIYIFANLIFIVYKRCDGSEVALY